MLISPRLPLSESLTIGHKASQSLYYAFEQAERIKLPLNRHVTANFACTAIDPCQAVPAFSWLRRSYFNKWSTRRCAVQPTGIYAFENVLNEIPYLEVVPGGPHNIHVHWVTHVPTKHWSAFEHELFPWFEKVTGGILDAARVLKVTAIDPDHLRSYLLKGSTDKWAGIYGAVAKPQGRIVGGRRSNTTSNLRRSARIALDRQLGIRRFIPGRPRVTARPPTG